MKTFIKILIITFNFSINYSLLFSQELTPVQIYNKTFKSILKIFAYDDKNYATGWGSAVVISEDGLVVTCFHIFKGASRIELRKNDIRVTDVKFVGADPEKDILILKIPSGLFPPVRTGNSDSVAIGEIVYTLGNPEDLDYTFAAGIISALRDRTDYDKNKQIQYSASISHGSSGGALLNGKGELIGVTSSTNERGQNLNFAVPINDYLKAKLVNPEDSSQVKAVTALCMAYSYFDQHYYFRANEYYSIYLSEFPNDDNAMVLSGKNDYYNGRNDSAISKYSRAININPKNKDAYRLRADAYSLSDSSGKGIEDYCNAILLDSTDEDALFSRATWYEFKSKEYNKAIDDFSSILELNPGNRYICLYRGETSLKKGDTTNAINDFYASIDRKYDLAPTCSLRGIIFADLGYSNEAIEDFTQAINLEPDNSSYYFSRAIQYTKKSEHQKAVYDYLIAINLDCTNPSAYNNLAYEYYHMDNFDFAIKYFKKTIELDSMHFDAYLGLALVSYAQNDIFQSKKYIRKACEIEPLLNKGSKGLLKLENKGYFWSNGEKNDFNEIFVILGFDQKTESNDENKAQDAIGQRKNVSLQMQKSN